MMPKREVQEWLDSLPDDAEISIDDGGLCLVTDAESSSYLEIGGLPEEEN